MGTEIRIKTGKEVVNFPSIAEANRMLGRERFWRWLQMGSGLIMTTVGWPLLVYNLVSPSPLHSPLVDAGIYSVGFGIALAGKYAKEKNYYRTKALRDYSDRLSI